MAKSKGKNKTDSKVPPLFCTAGFITKAFGISGVSLHHWVKDGCPKNPDGSYSVLAIYNWRQENLKSKLKLKDVDAKRKEKDIELKDAQIQKIRGNLIDKSLMETILGARASNLNNFLTKTFIQSAHYFVGKNINEIRSGFREMVQDAMDIYIGDTNAAKKTG